MNQREADRSKCGGAGAPGAFAPAAARMHAEAWRLQSPAEVIAALPTLPAPPAHTDAWLVLALSTRQVVIQATLLTAPLPPDEPALAAQLLRPVIIANAASMLVVAYHGTQEGDLALTSEDRMVWGILDAGRRVLDIPLDDYLIVSPTMWESVAGRIRGIRPG
jgi:hypothetical protein